MTSGENLKKVIGLESFNTVWITRILIPTSIPIYYIIYDSRRKNLPLPKAVFKGLPFVAMTYSGAYLAHDRFEKPTTTPLMKIEAWGGNPANGIFTLVDVAYAKFLDKRNFDYLPESTQSNITKEGLSMFLSKDKLKELTLYDLKDPSASSDFTKAWAKDKIRVMGQGGYKLLDIYLSKIDRSCTFIFQVSATTKGEPAPSLNSEYKYSDPKKRVIAPSKTMINNPEKTYELQIQIVNFFEWLDTTPEGYEITAKDIKDILEISDVKFYSSEPSWLYQGAQYWATELDASIVPETRKPQKWNAPHLHTDNGTFLTKSLRNLVRQISFYFNPMASMLNKKLKDRGLL